MKIKSILVSQPKPADISKTPFADMIKKYGVNFTFEKFIKLDDVTASELRQEHIKLPEYTAIILTSRNAVDHFFRVAKEMRYNVPETLKYFCINESTALYLQRYVQYRKRKVFFGTTGKIQDLVPTMAKHKTERYLVPLSDVHNDDVKNQLDEKKLQHTECYMYRTVSNDFSEEEVKNFDYDMLIFFSPTGIEALTKNFPNFDQGDIRIGTFGPSTAKAVEEKGLRLDLQAPSAEYPSMTGALKAYLKAQNKKSKK